MPDLKTAKGLLAYAAQIQRQIDALQARPGCANRKPAT